MALEFDPAVLAAWNLLDSNLRETLERDLERIAGAPRARVGVLATAVVTVAFRVDRATKTLVVTRVNRDR